MNYCDTCIHREVCGEEDARDPAVTFCADRIEHCEDCINRIEVIKVVDEVEENYIDALVRFRNGTLSQSDNIFEKLRTEILILPSIVPKQRTGHWIPCTISSGRDSWECSVCGRRARGKLKNLPYCHCGAKMEVNGEID